MNSLNNARHPGESFEAYRARRKLTQAYVKRWLRGRPAQGYINGPHRSHYPKRVTEQVVTRGGEIKTIEVVHPGTLLRVQPKPRKG